MIKIGAIPPKPGVSAGLTGEAAGGGEGLSKKSSSSSSKKAAAAAAAAASGSERASNGGKQTSQALVAAAGTNGEPTKMTCTCPHLVSHPNRADLIRKLVDVRIEVKRMRVYCTLYPSFLSEKV